MKAKHILVVEDEEQTRFSVSLILKKDGYKVTTATNGLEAFEMINKLEASDNPVDLLLTDIQLPGLTGLELIEKLANLKLSLPILVITGYGDKEMVIKLMRSGCSEYIDKPFEPEDMVKRVGAVIEKAEMAAAEREKKTAMLEQEKTVLNWQLEAYRQNFEALRKQIDSAVGAYYNITHDIQKDTLSVHASYRYLPYKELGGDFVDIRNTHSGCDILVADVAGHDMGASYYTVMIKAFFDENCRRGNDGQSFFKLLNRHLVENGRNDRMLTGVFVRLNLETMHGEVVSAAHPSPIKLSPRLRQPRPLIAKGDLLGIHEEVSFDIRTFDFRSGDRLFLYTDGLINANRIDGPTGKITRLYESGLDDLLIKYCPLSLEDMIDHIWKDIMEFCRYKACDDIMLLAIEIP